ncbi:MAG: hypothetical protein WC969_13525 [Elusimicrobiota bacterium]
MKTELAKVPLRPQDPHLCDLFGVLAGVKPVLYTDVLPSEEVYIRDLCRALGLRWLKPERPSGKHFHFQKKAMFLVGRRAGDLAAAARCWRGLLAPPAGGPRGPSASLRNNFDWGCWLGYPECCVRAYLRWRDERDAGAASADLVRATAEATPAGGPLPFLLNDVFNHFSLLSTAARAQDKRRYERFIALNRGLMLPSLNAVSWHPCTYRCEESLYKAGVVYGLMRRYAPDWARRIREGLARPVLHFGKYEFAVFEDARSRRGPAGALRVRAGKLRAPRSLLSPGLRTRLTRAGGFELRAGALVVGGKAVARPEPPLWLDFRGTQGCVA